MASINFETTVEYGRLEDGGEHLVAEFGDDTTPVYGTLVNEGDHRVLRSLEGRRVRITLEVID